MGPTKSLTTLAGDRGPKFCQDVLFFLNLFVNVEGLGLVGVCSKLT